MYCILFCLLDIYMETVVVFLYICNINACCTWVVKYWLVMSSISKHYIHINFIT